MRRVAIINQKGGVGKTTTTANLGAALAIQGRRVVVIDMDAQANLSLALGVEARSGSPTAYSVLTGDEGIDACLRDTKVPGLRLLPSNIDLSGAELELASAMGREYLLRDALKEWDDAHRKQHGRAAADYVLFDCPPSLGLLSINALAAAGEVLITLQTEFLALQGMSKLVEIVALLKKRLNPDLVVAGIVPTLYDIRLKLAREVLGEIRRYFKDQVVPHPIRANVKLAEAPSFAQTIFEYAPDSHGALDYVHLARVLVEREARDADLAGLPAFDAGARLAAAEPVTPSRRVPPPRKPAAGTAHTAASQKPGAAAPAHPPIEAAPSASATRSKAKAPTSNASAAVPRSSAATSSTSAAAAAHAPAKSTPAEPASKAALSTKGVARVEKIASSGPSSASARPADKQPPSPTPSMPARAHDAVTAKKPAARTKEIEAEPAEVVPATRSAASKPETSKPAPPKPLAAQSKPANGSHAKPERDPPAIAARTRAKTLKPVPRTARVDDIPPLPPDAFEILSTPIDP